MNATPSYLDMRPANSSFDIANQAFSYAEFVHENPCRSGVIAPDFSNFLLGEFRVSVCIAAWRAFWLSVLAIAKATGAAFGLRVGAVTQSSRNTLGLCSAAVSVSASRALRFCVSPIPDSALLIPAPLHFFISHVIQVGSRKQMPRVATLLIVAVMTNMRSFFGRISKGQKISYSMSAIHLARDAHGAIPRPNAPLPLQTASRFISFEPGEEVISLLCRQFWYRIRSVLHGINMWSVSVCRGLRTPANATILQPAL